MQTEVFRDAELPKGRVNVTAHEGVVELRGEVARKERIDELVRRSREVRGVRAVKNLLHTTAVRHQG